MILGALEMFIIAAHGLAFILAQLMALLLSYFEIWPGCALGAVFDDPSRLYEYDPDNPASEQAPTLTANAAARRTNTWTRLDVACGRD